MTTSVILSLPVILIKKAKELHSYTDLLNEDIVCQLL